jgi:hypothetical protein
MTSKVPLARAPSALDDDALVPEELIARLLQASESAILDLSQEFEPTDRANLAMFCYRKAHLRQIGLSIAATCELSTLVQAWGTGLGRALFTQSRDRTAAPEGVSSHRRPKITLARLVGAPMPGMELDD